MSCARQLRQVLSRAISEAEANDMEDANRKYNVYVDENSHYMDEDERRFACSYDDCETAVAACKKIVERSLTEQYQEGMTAERLLNLYKSFGEDPWISSTDDNCKFSAWDY